MTIKTRLEENKLQALKNIYPTELIYRIKLWLGEEGINFFMLCKEKYNSISPVYIEPGLNIPHPVHLREGMQVRNWMRSQPEFSDFTDHDYDNHWTEIIELAIKE
jgi:hypothetical protein